MYTGFKSTDCLQPVAILWDMQNCAVPQGVNAEDVAVNVQAALKVQLTRKGSITLFSAYGDFTRLAHGTRQGFQKTGISLIDVPHGTKDAADKAILVDMFLFALDNPPPCTILLISGDVDFALALHKLGQRGYCVVLAIPSQPQQVSPALCNACQFLWDWPSVARGKALAHAKAHSACVAKNDNPSAVLNANKHVVDQVKGKDQALSNPEVGPSCNQSLNSSKITIGVPVGIYEQSIKTSEEYMQMPVATGMNHRGEGPSKAPVPYGVSHPVSSQAQSGLAPACDMGFPMIPDGVFTSSKFAPQYVCDWLATSFNPGPGNAPSVNAVEDEHARTCKSGAHHTKIDQYQTAGTRERGQHSDFSSWAYRRRVGPITRSQNAAPKSYGTKSKKKKAGQTAFLQQTKKIKKKEKKKCVAAVAAEVACPQLSRKQRRALEAARAAAAEAAEIAWPQLSKKQRKAARALEADRAATAARAAAAEATTAADAARAAVAAIQQHLKSHSEQPK